MAATAEEKVDESADSSTGPSDTPSQRPKHEVKVRPLRQRDKLFYAFGHVLNDVSASIWFSYFLLFATKVKGFGSVQAGRLMMVGQVADGLATPLIGLFCDYPCKFWLCRQIGQRIAWHLLGTIAVMSTFPIIFSRLELCRTTNPSSTLCNILLIVIFQIGWATTQVSHLSLIPDLTPCSQERLSLSSVRNAGTVATSIVVYLATFGVLGLDDGDPAQLTTEDAHPFEMMIWSLTAIGTMFSIAFLVGIADPSRAGYGKTVTKLETGFTLSCSGRATSIEQHSKQLKWYQWFAERKFYVVALIYMADRLYTNISQVYVGLYLHDTLRMPKQTIAIAPLVIYTSGFLVSLPLHRLAATMREETIHGIGNALAIIAAVWLAYGDDTALFSRFYIYIICCMIGVSSAIVRIISISIANNLIGESTSSGGFVIGAMSFVDKFSSGAIVMAIQSSHALGQSYEDIQTNRNIYHYVMSYGCGGMAALGLLSLFLLPKPRSMSERQNGRDF